MPFPWGPLIGLGGSLLGGLFGGRQRRREQQAAERANQEQIAAEQDNQRRLREYEDYARQYYEPRLGGAEAERSASRGRAGQAFEDIYGAPGYTDEERRGQFMDQPTRDAVLMTPERAAGIRRLTATTSARPFEAAEEQAKQRAAVTNNYAPGFNALLQRLAQDKARIGAESALAAETGIYREGADRALQVADRDQDAWRNIGASRRNDRQFGAGGLANMSQADQQRLAGLERGMFNDYGGAVRDSADASSRVGRARAGGAAARGMPGFWGGFGESLAQGAQQAAPAVGSWLSGGTTAAPVNTGFDPRDLGEQGGSTAAIQGDQQMSLGTTGQAQGQRTAIPQVGAENPPPAFPRRRGRRRFELAGQPVGAAA